MHIFYLKIIIIIILLIYKLLKWLKTADNLGTYLLKEREIIYFSEKINVFFFLNTIQMNNQMYSSLYFVKLWRQSVNVCLKTKNDRLTSAEIVASYLKELNTLGSW